MPPVDQVALFGDPDEWERDALHRKSTHCPEKLGPHSTLPSPSCPWLLACVPQEHACGPTSWRAEPALFTRGAQGSRWSAPGGEFTWSLLLRDTKLLMSCYVCAVLAIHFTFLSLFLHSYKQMKRPTGKEEEEGVLLTWEELKKKQEKAAGGFTRKGPQKDDDYGDHTAL